MTTAEPTRLSLDALPEIVALVPGLAERVERQERELASLRADLAGLREAKADPLDDIATVKELVASGKVTIGVLRSQLFHRESNGLGRHVSRRGKELCIRRSGYARWLLAGGAGR